MNTEHKGRLFWIGIFVATSITLFIMAVIYLGDDSLYGKSNYYFYAKFQNASGLAKGDKVKFLGQKIGQITDIKIPRDNPRQVIVTLSIYETLGIKIPVNSSISVKREGIIGQMAVVISPGDSDEYIRTGQSVSGRIESDPLDLDFDPVMQDISATARALSSIINEEEVQSLQNIIHNTDSLINNTKNSLQISDEINTIINNIESFSRELKNMADSLNSVMQPQLGAVDSIFIEIKDFSAQLDEATAGIKSFASSAETLDSSMLILKNIINEIERGQGTLGLLLKEEELYNNLNETVVSAKDLIQDLKENPETYFRAYWRSKK